MRKLLQIIIWISILLSCIPLGHAQHSFVKDYTVEHYTNENGLPQNSANIIFSDSEGFIWIGTESGVVRYDGKNFKTYLVNGSTEESGFQTVVPGNGREKIFVINSHKQPFEIKKGWVHPHHGRISNAYLKLFALAQVNDFYLGLNQVVSYEQKKPSFRHYFSVDSNSFYLHDDAKVFYYRGSKLIYSITDPQKNYLTYFLLNGTLYAHGGDNLFYCLDNEERQFVTLHANGLRQTSTDPHIYWQSVNKGVYYADNNVLYELKRNGGTTLRADTILTDYDFKKNNIICIYKNESTGDLFLGSGSDGLFVLKKHRFSTQHINGDGGDNVFYAHDYMADGKVVVPQAYAIGKENVVKWYNGQLTMERYSILKSNYGQKSVWGKYGRDLFEFDINGNLLNTKKFASGTIYLLYEKDGIMWVVMRDGRIFNINLQIEESKFREVINIPEASYLCQISANDLLVGSRKGFYSVTFDSRTARKTLIEPRIFVKSIYADGSNNVWLTVVDKGLMLYRNKKIFKFPLDAQLFLRQSHCIVEDKKQNFWISGNRGMLQVNKQDLLDYADGKLEDIYYFYFTKEYGFASNEFNGGCQPCGVHWPDGSISFPSIDGLVIFHPDSIPTNLPVNKIIIEDLQVDGQATESCDTLYLSHDFQRVSMHFATAYFGNFKNVKMEVAIESGSASKMWHALGNDQSFLFNTLPYGTHKLLVRKSIGSNRYVYSSLVIKVKAAFYQTWWFILLVIAGSLLLLNFFVRLRLKYITTKNAELERLISERTNDLSETISALQKSKKQLREKSDLQQKIILGFTHDLKSPLMYLMLTGQKLYEDLHKVPREMSDSVKIMYDSSFSIYHSMDNFLNYAKIYFTKDNLADDEFSVKELVQEEIKIFTLIAASKNINIISHVKDDVYVQCHRVALSIALHNLLDNAIKYTDEGQVEIYLETYTNYISIHIKDNGMGMEETEVKEYSDFFADKNNLRQTHEFGDRGVGLQMVKEMMDLLKGKIELKSKIDEGTQVVLTLVRKE